MGKKKRKKSDKNYKIQLIVLITALLQLIKVAIEIAMLLG